MMIALEDVETQINGIVSLDYFVDFSGSESNFAEILLNGAPMLLSLPYRYCAIHICHNELRLKTSLTLLQMVLGRQNRVRFRTHFGSPTEVQYDLLSFGVPELPLKVDGTLMIDAFKVRMERQRQVEAEAKLKEARLATASDKVMYPRQSDILLGRGYVIFI